MNWLVCGSCKENCGSVHYEYTKEGSFILCEKSFKTGNYEKNKSADDFMLINSGIQSSIWTEAEILLLLESVLKHGDEWDLVAQDVQTKSKLDCISKLTELPFGDLMLGSAYKNHKFLGVTGDASNLKEAQLTFNESQESVKLEDPSHFLKDEDPLNGYSDNQSQPSKRIRTKPTSNTSYLMYQVARISTAVGPHVTASAAEAAVTALCYENQCSREIFNEDDIFVDLKASSENIEQKRAAQGNLLDGDEATKQSETQDPPSNKNTIQINLRMRAATGTALGAAAAHAKCLADQEERRMEQLKAILIEMQMKKLKRKMKYFDELELVMEKESAHIEELEESLLADRLNVLQRIFDTGISRWKDHASVKSQTGSVQ